MGDRWGRGFLMHTFYGVNLDSFAFPNTVSCVLGCSLAYLPLRCLNLGASSYSQHEYRGVQRQLSSPPIYEGALSSTGACSPLYCQFKDSKPTMALK